MITKWKVFNFKSVRKETELDMAPLTIFAGANSSGKSTFLQSILLIAQTLANRIGSRSVVLNGAYTRLGQFDDLRSAGSDANQIVIGWTCKPVYDTPSSRLPGYRYTPFSFDRERDSLHSIKCEIAFDTEETGAQKETTQVQPQLFSSQISAEIRDPKEGDRRFSMAILRSSRVNDSVKRKWIDAIDSDDALVRNSLQYDVEVDETSLAEIHEELKSAIPVGCVLRHFLPARLALGIDMITEESRVVLEILLGEKTRRATRRNYLNRAINVPKAVLDLLLDMAGRINIEAREQLSGMLLSDGELFNDIGIPLESTQSALSKLPLNIRNEMRRQILEMPNFSTFVEGAVRQDRADQPAVIIYRRSGLIGEATMYLDAFFSSSVRYLGPLRDEPKSLYPLAPAADPFDVGIKGEHTAAVLELHKNTQVRYIPTSCFAGVEIQVKPVMRTLEAAVVDWLQYLDVAQNVQSRDRGKLGHELTVSIPGSNRSHDLTHVGVGVSQVLPILVASLLAETDTTLIFEQPELHLHPKVQTLLADFFLSMTQLGKQCIVETHSEYLINRLRLRTAAAMTNNPWVAATKVYFVEREDDSTSFREVAINEYGAVPDWPKGFFDQSQQEAEAILRAAAIKRKTQRGIKNA